ncbi:hypothetical protein [Limosilactobacillus reuteri]|uniref:hypothetical protein n=1 Tax=Limosilactobacillus reuteri TaxID=1598 RepID=UPI00128E44B9|nr:hypothetical protein [Limosilactobacillus reuteri]MCC4482789.1 hypothetical protein [Limosilactobacillus reuteri]MCU4691894.1 hypothetical protein [Limosilactobacillus reuteri]MQB63689.1 hypothetical protein [Limosilactobacillus reuteri]MQB93979.1 hypothetical protein [Limosilactobacillus reuteri]
MFGENLLNAKQLAKKLGVGNTTVFKLLKQKNNSGQACPVHQLAPGCRKYYIFDEVKQWLMN